MFKMLMQADAARILVFPNDLQNNAEFKSLVMVAEVLAARHEVTLLVNSRVGLTLGNSTKMNMTVVTYASPNDAEIPNARTDILQQDFGSSFFNLMETNRLQVELSVCEALLRRQYLTIQLLLQEFDLIFADSSNICARILIDYLNIPTLIWCYNSYDIACDFSRNSVATSMSSSQDMFTRLMHNLRYLMHLNFYQPVFIFQPFNELKDRYGYNRGLSVSDTFSRNKPLVILNADFSIDTSRPIVPYVVPIAGLPFSKHEELTPDIEAFLARSSIDGVIFVDLFLEGSWLIQKQITNILDILIKSEQNVILKDGINISMKFSGKLKTVSSVFRSAVLANKKTRLFITSCSHSAIHEMAYYGLPVIFLSTFGDNADLCKRILDTCKTGKVLDILELEETDLEEEISTIISNEKYRKNVEKLSNIFRHQIKHSKERLFHWIDFVSNHKRIDYLHSNPALQLSWYQHCMLDQAILVLFVACLGFIILYLIIKQIFRRILGSGRRKQKHC